MNYFKVLKIIAAITNHARFAGSDFAARRGVGYFSGSGPGVRIDEIENCRNGSVSVIFAAYDGDSETADDSDAWPFTVTFSQPPEFPARDAGTCDTWRIMVDTGTGPGSYKFDTPGHASAGSVANRVIRYVCAAYDIGESEE